MMAAHGIAAQMIPQMWAALRRWDNFVVISGYLLFEPGTEAVALNWWRGGGEPDPSAWWFVNCVLFEPDVRHYLPEIQAMAGAEGVVTIERDGRRVLVSGSDCAVLYPLLRDWLNWLEAR